jgi:benzaldehyde dehydrogenase (NAD)
MPVFDEEVFGPVAAITTYSTDDEAVELANRTDYGLSAAIISRSLGRAMASGTSFARACCISTTRRW